MVSSAFGEPGQKPSGVFTVNAEYVLWYLAGRNDSSIIASTDILTNPGAALVETAGDADHTGRAPISGGRVAFGYWQLQDNPWIPGGARDLGVEAVFFFIGQRSVNATNGPTPTLVRPFFDLNDRQESAFIVAAPGLATGSISGHAQVDLWGAEANVWKGLYYNYPGTNLTVSMMGGFRYLSADSLIEVSSTSVFDPNLPVTSVFFPFSSNRLEVFDSFATHNRFYGGQFGIDGKWWVFDKFCVEGAFKLGLGVTSEDLTIVGSQFRTFANGATASYTGGLLALPSNIGQFHRDKFAQVPEFDLKSSYPVMDHLTLTGTFSALYWSRIARPGQQVDRQLDITQIPNFPLNPGAVPTGLGRPAVPFNQSSLWVIGASFGVEVKW